MNKSSDYEKKLMGTIIQMLLSVFKWLCLIVCVVDAGLTIGLLVMMIVKGNAIPNNLLAMMGNYISSYSGNEILHILESNEKIVIATALIGYGFASSLTYGLLYNLTTKFKTLFNTILNKKMFTKENMILINKAIPISFLLTFVYPVFLYIISYSTPLFHDYRLEVSGILYIFVVYVLKFIFEYGLELQNQNNQYRLELKENKIEEKEIPAKKQKKTTKKTETKTTNTRKKTAK